MTPIRIFLLTLLLVLVGRDSIAATLPWQHGPLEVSANHRFLQHKDGTPFFWLGETAWLLPERLNREEAQHYLQRCHEAGYNMVQVQVLNAIPSYNAYGYASHPLPQEEEEVPPRPNQSQKVPTSPNQSQPVPPSPSYWSHLDYIIDLAAQQGIYIGMVCVWGSQVKSGRLDEAGAREYGAFLAKRYQKRPNIIWIIGGDVQGDIHPEVWQALATTIKQTDHQHLMTYHPRGRYTSARWWSQAEWIDFHTFQSGHRRYGQRMGNKDYPIPDNTEEDNWMYVDSTWAYKPIKPVLDDEPIYEGIPQGLHDAFEPLWTADHVRRYAYWSVFAGSCGHTYGHSAIMQFQKPGYPSAYHNRKMWYDALNDPGFNQMQYLKQLMLALPYFERVPDQSIVQDNGTQYERLAATRGNDYLLVYNFTSRPMKLDLDKISGTEKNVWWMNAATGQLTYLGSYASRVLTFRPHDTTDGVLIAIDASKSYLQKDQTHIANAHQPADAQTLGGQQTNRTE